MKEEKSQVFSTAYVKGEEISNARLWGCALEVLKDHIPEQELSTCVRPLRAEVTSAPAGAGDPRLHILLYAPNETLLHRVEQHFSCQIRSVLGQIARREVWVEFFNQESQPLSPGADVADGGSFKMPRSRGVNGFETRTESGLDPNFVFENFVEGGSNNIALAAARQVTENLESNPSYNPLVIYGGVGLGKTHLMQAVGNRIKELFPRKNVLYIHSERFLTDLITAINLNATQEFRQHYRYSMDVMLIDDIQFIAGKEATQVELFHTFNALLESGKQMVMTCDRYPKEIDNLEERLKSRFGSGLPVTVEPPDLETRTAILLKKAEQMEVELPGECALYMAQKIPSNGRELEGALKRVAAHSKFMVCPINVGLVKEALRDLLATQARQVSIDSIQRVVAEYFNIRVADLLSKRRTRSVVRPRQIAMTLAKELTRQSLPEIGEAFGGKDHTTVLHANRKVKELLESNATIADDYRKLLRSITG